MGTHDVTPEAEVLTWQRKEAVVGDKSMVPMWGVAFTRLRPTGLIDRSGETERRIEITDRNRQIEISLLIAAMLLPIVFNGLAALLSRIKIGDGWTQKVPSRTKG